MMFSRHVAAQLSAYFDGELEGRKAAAVERHLTGCARCRAEAERVQTGMRLAASLHPVAAPAGLWAQIWSAREAQAAPFENVWSDRLAWVAAAMVMTVLGFAGWYTALREPLKLHAASPAASSLERSAWELHTQRLRSDLILGVETADIAELRRYVESAAGLHASIPVQRVAEDGRRLHMVGAKAVNLHGVRSALIAYEVDGEPVTLLTARLEDVADGPEAAVFAKDVRYRTDAGRKTLTWGTAGQAYVMVSSLPRLGAEGCMVCHTDSGRRELIRKAERQVPQI